jgi:hypothetical protein
VLGIVPENMLLSKKIRPNLTRDWSAEGMAPLRLLKLNVAYVRALIPPIEDGNVPLKLFPHMLK